MHNRISNQQAAAIAFIASNPGCSMADVCRYEWSGRGHSASYDRVNRLIRRRLVKCYWRNGRTSLEVVA